MIRTQVSQSSERPAHLDRHKFFLARGHCSLQVERRCWEWRSNSQLLSPWTIGENADDLLEDRVTTPSTPPSQHFMSGTVPYGPGSFGSPYPSTQFDSSLGPSTSTATSTYCNIFTSFPTPQSIPHLIHQQLSHLRAPHHPALKHFLLPNHKYFACVLWLPAAAFAGVNVNTRSAGWATCARRIYFRIFCSNFNVFKRKRSKKCFTGMRHLYLL